MAGWSDLFEFEGKPLPKQTMLVVGEVSSLVWDRVNDLLDQYDQVVRVEDVQNLHYSLGGAGSRIAYLMVDPTEDVLEQAVQVMRKGSTESFFFLVSGDPSQYPKSSFDFVKRKAQQSRMYFTLSAPKTEAAQSKMVSYFLMRWRVTNETSSKVCSILKYSPGALYLFDKQFIMCTGGQVLPSTQTKEIVSELLGNDTPSLIVYNIIYGVGVDELFDNEFTHKVLSLLHTVLMDARLIQGASSQSHTTVSAICKFTKLTQFQVLRAGGLADDYTVADLRACESLITWAMENSKGNPDLLSVVSRLWGRV